MPRPIIFKIGRLSGLKCRPALLHSPLPASPQAVPFTPFLSPGTSDTRIVRQLGSVLLVPNLLLTTLATVAYLQRPPLFASPQRPPQVVATQQVNLLESTLAPAPFPIGKQQLASAQLALFRVGLDQQINLLESTLAPAPALTFPIGKQQLASAPAALLQVAPPLHLNLLGTILAPVPALPIGGTSFTSTPSLLRVNADTSRGTPAPLVAPAPPALPTGKAALASAPEQSRWLPDDTTQGTPKTLTLDLLFAPANLTESISALQRPWDVADTTRGSSVALLTAVPPPPSMPRGGTFQALQRWPGSVVDTSQSSPRVLLAATPPPPFTPPQHLGPVKFWWQPTDTSQASPVPLLTFVQPPFIPAQHVVPARFNFKYADTSQGSPQPLVAPPAPAVPFVPLLIGTQHRSNWQPADTTQSTPKPLYADARAPFAQTDFPPPVDYRQFLEREWSFYGQNPDNIPPAVVVPPVVEKDFSPGVGGAPRYKDRQRKKYLVEIDGEDFYVASASEAAGLLAQAQELAEEKAQHEFDKALASTLKLPKLRRVIAHKLQPPVIRVPQAEVDPVAATIEAQTRALQANIAQLYADIARSIEIGVLLRRQLDDDDEEAITVLLL